MWGPFEFVHIKSTLSTVRNHFLGVSRERFSQPRTKIGHDFCLPKLHPRRGESCCASAQGCQAHRTSSVPTLLRRTQQGNKRHAIAQLPPMALEWNSCLASVMIK